MPEDMKDVVVEEVPMESAPEMPAKESVVNVCDPAEDTQCDSCQ